MCQRQGPGLRQAAGENEAPAAAPRKGLFSSRGTGKHHVLVSPPKSRRCKPPSLPTHSEAGLTARGAATGILPSGPPAARQPAAASSASHLGNGNAARPVGGAQGPTCQSRSPAHTGRGHCLKSLFSERESYTQRGSRWQGHPGVTKGRDSAAGHPAPSSLTADGPRTGPRVQWGPLSPPGCSQPAAPQQPRVSALHFRQGRSWGKTRPPDEL